MADSKPSYRRFLLPGFVVVVALAALAPGLFRVDPGEIAVRLAGDRAAGKIWGEGWHWRLPFSSEPLRLPREPIALDLDLELRSAEGAAVILEVAGRFRIEEAKTGDWIAAAGGAPFLDSLKTFLEAELGAEIRGVEPDRLFGEEEQDRLRGAAVTALIGAGLRVEDLSLSAPVEKNPVALAVLRSGVARLASPSGKKILLVGWDGADWLMIRPLLAQGRLPHLSRLMRRGVSGELRSQPPLLSPLIWTTIATGREVVDHGIADFVVQSAHDGAYVPISSTSRKVHALWTILPVFGLSSDVVAWWATWPAEEIQGTMITDRVAYQLFDFDEASDSGDKVYPPQAWERVQQLLVPAEEVSPDELRRFIGVDQDEIEAAWTRLPPDRRQENPINHLRKILATTRSYHAVALDLLDSQADLTMVYYEGTDTVGHLFGRYLPPAMPGVSAAEVRRFGHALPEFYAYADELLGELLAKIEDDTVVMLVSDHGFFTGETRPASDPSDFTAGGAPQWHRLYGILVAAGEEVGRGEIEDASILDLAPTILSTLGLPPAEDMPGRVLDEISAGAPAPAAPQIATQLASYEVVPRARRSRARASLEEDEERLRELVALGYVSAAALNRGGGGEEALAGEASPGAGSEGPRAAPAELEAVATEAYNLGRIHQRGGDFEAARGQYRLAIERLPSFGAAYAALAQVAALENRHSEAFDLLVEGFRNSGTMPMAGLTGLVDEASRCGRLEEAGRVLEGLRRGYSDRSAYHAALGFLHEKAGRPDEALAAFGRSLEIDPLDDLSMERKVALLRQQGREPEAREFFDRSAERARGSLGAMNQLAVVAMRQRWPDKAEPLLRRVLESDPGNPGFLANLAQSLALQGRTEEAVSTMRQAVRREPDNARNHFNLGAMLASQGRIAEAIESFEAAVEHGLRDPGVHLALARMYFRAGDPGHSETQLETALVLDPANQEAKELLHILRNPPPG